MFDLNGSPKASSIEERLRHQRAASAGSRPWTFAGTLKKPVGRNVCGGTVMRPFLNFIFTSTSAARPPWQCIVCEKYAHLSSA